LGENVDYNQLYDKYKSLYENDISEIPVSIDIEKYKKIRNIENELKLLLNEVIIGNENVDIADLIKILDNHKWVEDGTEYLKKTNGICPFCQKKTIDENLQEQFIKFFDDTYKNKIEKIKKYSDQYKLLFNQFISQVQEITKYFNRNNIISNEYDALKEHFNSNMIILNNKMQRPNETMQIISLFAHKKILSNIIKILINENNIFNGLDDEKKQLQIMIWKYISYNSANHIINYDKRVKKYKKLENSSSRLIGINTIKINEVKLKIERLRTQTVNTEEAIKNITNLLKNAGFEGFEIVEIDKTNNISKYQIKRPHINNTQNIFKTLSEGEKNFISFLYFNQLCIGTDNLQNSTKKKIIVIDDPVSSLDSQALFIVSTLIRNFIEKDKINKNNFFNIYIEQLFLFTHNVYFYKEVSLDRFICKDYCHFHIKKNKNISFIENTGKEKINDDYSLLWITLKGIKNNPDTDNSMNILISNTMRRIIESYTNFIGNKENTWAVLNDKSKNDQNYFIWCEFISIINEESHKLGVFDAIYYQRLSSVQPKILFDIFKDIFEEIGKEHYEKMFGEVIDIE
jgi:wobble nucleotide-excising tRNase